MSREHGTFPPLRSVWRFRGRFALILLTAWALAMVVPDFYRLARPLASFGFDVNGDGLVIDARGPFAEHSASPAWQAGLRRGDRLDLRRMRCIPLNTLRCATALATLGGLNRVADQRRAEVALGATARTATRDVSLVAKATPLSRWAAAVLPLDQLAAILVILAAAWLVWTRPGKMTWGFFLYILWFNPGQSSQYYALLQYWPAALLMQDLAGAIAQGAGLAGFLLFTLRAPRDECGPRWRPVEKALPAIGLLLALLLALAYANVFGYPSELATRAGVMSGFAAGACAFFVLLARRREQNPADFQRLRWVIWGCLIGLPSLTLADLGEQTSLLDHIWGNVGAAPPEEFWSALRLINGVLCLFVFEAVRRPLVVSVAIPLRRVTILGLLLSAPALLAHEQFQQISEGLRESITLPNWVWLVIASCALFIISRVHEIAVHHADRYFNRDIARASRAIGASILQANDAATIEAQLAGEVGKMLKLASACVFRRDGPIFRRSGCASGWGEQAAEELQPDDPVLEGLASRRPFAVCADQAARRDLPDGLARPVFAVPVGNRFDCYAIAFYGAHAAGDNLSNDERATLTHLAGLAGDIWTKLDQEALLRRVEALEIERDSLAMKLATVRGGAPEGGAEASPATRLRDEGSPQSGCSDPS